MPSRDPVPSRDAEPSGDPRRQPSRDPLRTDAARPDAAAVAGTAAVAGAAAVDGTATPYWWEDPDLAAAVAEVEEFAATAGWDQAPQMFALVRTADLLSAQPGLAPTLADAGVFTPIAQDPLAGGDLSEALSQILWPAEVTGCVLVQEIVVLPPAAVQPDAAVPGTSARAGNDVEITAEQAAAHPDRAEARLAAGVLRGSVGGACLLRVRGENDATPLRGADLAPNLLTALQATFLD